MDLSRSLHCTNEKYLMNNSYSYLLDEDALERLLDLRLFDFKNLLHHILSCKEFINAQSNELAPLFNVIN